MTRVPDLLLVNILASARDAVRYASGLEPKTFENLPLTDGDKYRALKNALTELGEAVKSLPPGLTDRTPELGWQGLAGLRDIVAHQYFGLDMERLWPVLVEELPALIPEVERLIAEYTAPDDDPPSSTLR